MPALLAAIGSWIARIGTLILSLKQLLRWVPKLGEIFRKLFAGGAFFQKIWIAIRRFFAAINTKGFTILTYIGVFFTWIAEKLQKILTLPFIGACLWFIVRFLVKFIAKHPILAMIALVASDLFPTVMGTIFRFQGLVALRVAIPIITKLFNAMRSIGEDQVNEFSDVLHGTLSELPDCVGSHIAYLDVAGDIGLLISAFGLCVTYRLMAWAYGSFLPKK